MCVYIYICIYVYVYIGGSLLSLPPFPLSHPSRSSQNARLGSLCYIAASIFLYKKHEFILTPLIPIQTYSLF